MKLRPENPNQNLGELMRFVDLAQSLKVRKYLEIGSRFGDSLYAVMANLPVPSIGIAVDLEARPELYATRDELRKMGHDCIVLSGSSRNHLNQQMIGSAAPFDLILIDGDHTYDAVAADWRIYMPHGKTVVFHDIVNPENPSVGQLWTEIKARYETKEIISSNSQMGFGIVGGAVK